jgi:hypothetical protein
MKVLLVFLTAGFLATTGLCWTVIIERDALRARLSQQSYQLEALVSMYNNKRPFDRVTLLGDGTVDYWRGMVDSTTVDTTYLHDNFVLDSTTAEKQ